MPKTKLQEIIFGIMMTVVMVYGMEVYNISLSKGALSNLTFMVPLGELVILSIIAITIEILIVCSLAKKLAFKLVNPEKDRSIVIILAISIMTVCCMCPTMSLIATILFKGFNNEIFSRWIQAIVLNFPMALCWQIFVAGPLVRFVFEKLFPEQVEICDTTNVIPQ
jgi:hypothetical protein